MIQLGRIGKGPGEFVSINNVSLSADENKVALFDPGRQRVNPYYTGSLEYQDVGVEGLANQVVFGSENHLLASYCNSLAVTNSNYQFIWIDIRNNSMKPFALVPEFIRNWGRMEVPARRIHFYRAYRSYKWWFGTQQLLAFTTFIRSIFNRLLHSDPDFQDAYNELIELRVACNP